MFCSKNYAKPPLRKNQEGKKKTNEARPHADAGQELWNVKEGVRLSIQQQRHLMYASLFFVLINSQNHQPFQQSRS